MEWASLRAEITTATGTVGGLLRRAPSASTLIRGLDWNVGELGAHLVSIPRRYRHMIADGMPFPDSLAELNRHDIEAIAERDPIRLAELLENHVADLLAVLGDDGTAAAPFFGMQHTTVGLGGVLLGELLVHGLDLAHTLGEPWKIRRDQALAITDGLLPALAHSFDESEARRAAGTYHLRLRGGRDWTVGVVGGGVTIEAGRPARADLRVSADPVAFLLTGYRRMSRRRAALTGRMAAWGRKPWLGPRFDRLFVET